MVKILTRLDLDQNWAFFKGLEATLSATLYYLESFCQSPSSSLKFPFPRAGCLLLSKDVSRGTIRFGQEGKWVGCDVGGTEIDRTEQIRVINIVKKESLKGQ